MAGHACDARPCATAQVEGTHPMRWMPFMRRRNARLANARMAAAAALFAASLLPTTAAAQQPGSPPAQPPAKVVAGLAEQRTMAPHIAVPGTVHSRQDAEVAAEIAGRVTWVAEAGARVEAGDPIARLDTRELALRGEELEAQIRSLQSQLTFQTREAQRLEKLAAGNNTTVSRLEEAQSRRDTLAQDLARVRTQRERVALDMERAVVRAPFAGQIATRMLEVGEYSSPGAKVARLVAVDDVEVRVQVPVALAPQLREGMEVGLGDGGAAGQGRISRIIPVGEAQSRTFEVRVALPDGHWVVGGAVTVSLPSSAAQQVVAVHRDALVMRAGGTYVFRLNAENKAERLTVSTGTELDGWVEIQGGVDAGDRIIVRGAERLRDGQTVDPEPMA